MKKSDSFAPHFYLPLVSSELLHISFILVLGLFGAISPSLWLLDFMPRHAGLGRKLLAPGNFLFLGLEPIKSNSALRLPWEVTGLTAW